jgi:GAF domain-containing protein
LPRRPRPQRPIALLSALRTTSTRLAECADLAALFDQALGLLAQCFGISHALLLMADEPEQRLYTVASRGYSSTGVGSEVAFGDGVIGVAAQYRVPIRINHMTLEYAYSRAIRERLAAQGEAGTLELAIPFPGLAEPHSQLAVPMLAAGRLMGVLCIESPRDLAFDYDDEDALVTLAAQLGASIVALQQASDQAAAAALVPAGAPVAAPDQEVEVRHYRQNHSLFVGNDYLIKGVAGAILWKLLQLQATQGRSDFSNRELRAMPDLGLPEWSDNLEARLVLLQRRLAERCPQITLEKTGRGQLRLCLRAALRLVDVVE